MILQPNPKQKFGERLLRGFAQAGQALSSALSEYAAGKEKQAKSLSNRLKGVEKEGKTYLKDFHESILQNEKSYNDFQDLATKYASEGYGNREAFQKAVQDIANQRKEGTANFAGEKPKLGHGNADKDKIVGGSLGNFIDTIREGKQILDQNAPARLKAQKGKSFLDRALEVNQALGKNTAQRAREIAARPGQELAAIGTSTVGQALAFGPDLIEAALKRGGFIPQNADPNLVRQGLNKIQAWISEGRSEEDIKALAKRELGYSLGLTPLIFNGLNWLGGKLKGTGGIGGPPGSLAETVASGASEVAQKLKMRQGSTLSEAVFDDLFKKTGDNVARQRLSKIESGKGKISGELPKGPTVSRVERASPESKLFKTAEQQAIREKQLKLHPEYAEEIAKDAAERAARAEAKRPKTPVGEAGVAKRRMIAEAELPKAKDMYQRAIARVRGLESEMSRGVLPEHQARFDALYDAAVKELNEAEFYLKTVVNNAKFGEARVGFDAMRDAARNKMIQLEEKISAGETPELSLKDYNPKFIKEAKDLQKRKPLPATRHEDYFTQVHEGYANEYRNRIAALENKASEEIARQPTDFAKASERRLTDKKKEVLQKLVDHIEAENTIHRHKMALREIEQRKLAQERLGKFTRQAGEQKVKELAKEALKSPEKAAEAVDTAFEEVANRTKNQIERDRILRERDFVKKKLEQEAKNMQEGIGIGKSTQEASQGATTAKEASVKAGKFTRDLKEVLDSLKSGGKNFFQTRIGKDFLWGVSSEVLTQVAKGEDLPITPSTLVAIAGGRSGGVYRYAFSQMTKWIFNKGRKEEYKKALRDSDDEKLIKLRDTLSPKLRKKAIEEYREEIKV